MNDKYLIFSPYRSGLSNVIMSYECALAVAYVTGRKIVMPPTQYLVFINHGDKTQWHSPWDLFDEKIFKEEFDVVDYKDFDLPAEVKEKIQSRENWINDFDKHVDDCWTYTHTGVYPMTPANHCMIYNAGQYYGTQDYKDFVANREVIELFRSNKYIVFDNNFFQHYWYLIYPGVAKVRNNLKHKINRAIRYKQHYYKLYYKTPISNIGPYNAIHVRRNDFFIQFSNSLESVNTSDKLLYQLDRLVSEGKFDPSLPFFVSTDETDLSYFDPLRKKYKLIFSSEFNQNCGPLEKAILDKIICTKAVTFVGTLHSTFTKRIEIMRGLEGRSTNDYMGINIINYDTTQNGAFPWLAREDKEWGWNQSSYLQWTTEDVS